MERALRERWPIPPDRRIEILESLMQIVSDRTASPRERTSAAKALLHADQLNVEQEKMEQLDEHEYRARLVQLARQLPLGEVARLADERGISLDGEAAEGRTDAASNADGTQESGSEGHRNPDPSQP
jgi:hypothetical protein